MSTGTGYHCHICLRKVAFGWYGFAGKADWEIEDMVLKMLLAHYDQEHQGWSEL